MKLKLINFLVFLFSIQLYCQNNTYIDWENPNNFMKYNLSKVEQYSFKVKKNGKIKKDSTLLRSSEYNKKSSTINGIYHGIYITSHKSDSHIIFYNYKNSYIKDTLISISIEEEIVSEKRKKDEIEFIENITEYKYDSLNRKIEELSYSKINTINFYTKKDTLSHQITIQNPKRIEYEYDNRNRIIKQYKSTDSSVYFSKFDMKLDFKVSKSCGYCEDRYLTQEWIYQNNKLIEQVNYTYKKEKHTKKSYLYDLDANLIQQIDSTGWYLGLKKPYLESKTEIVYHEKGSVKTKNYFKDEYFFESNSKKIEYYDINNLLVKKDEFSDESLNQTIYNYKNLKIISKTISRENRYTMKEEYKYNDKGLIMEKKLFFNGILNEFIKYYYN